MSKSFSKNKGMTLIEITMVSALAFILIVLVSNLIITSLKMYKSSQKSIEMEEKIAQVMREFEFSTRAASHIVSANESDLIYYRYYDLTSLSPTRVRYFTENNQFKVGRTEPVGTPPNVFYPEANEEIVLLIEGVANVTNLFKYFDGTGTELASPPDLITTKMIELNITLSESASKQNKVVTGTTRVNLRNMKNNL